MKKPTLILLLVGGLVMFTAMVLAWLIVFKQLTRPRGLLSAAPQHGTSFTIGPNGSQDVWDAGMLANLKATLQTRFDRVGSRMFWEQFPDGRVRIAVPITSDKDIAYFKGLISHRGLLEFRLVHANSEQLVANNGVPPGYELLTREIPSVTSRRIEKVVVKEQSEPGLSGNIVEHAVTAIIGPGVPVINFELTPEAAHVFGEVTRKYVGRQLAILVDGELYSAPRIATPIESGMGQINGSFDRKEALTLGCMMQTPLPVSVRVIETTTY